MKLISGLITLFVVIFSFFNTSYAADVESKDKGMNNKVIYFAGGCFWGVEEFFSRVDGVVDVKSGYANGTKKDPSYKDVVSGRYGFAETVEVIYDSKVVSLDDLISYYFKIIDPTSKNKQGNDIGIQYRTGIYFTNEQDKDVIDTALKDLQKSYKEPIQVEEGPLQNFYMAEDYHQDYLKKNKNGYCHVNFDVLDEIKKEKEALEKKQEDKNSKSYQKMSKEEALKTLTKEQYEVTQNAATERPFTNKYYNFFEKGIYVDVVSREPLFLSKDKFETDCGWPAFSKPINEDSVVESKDFSYGMIRTEVKSKDGNSHLGHVFDDGPKELGSLRYCINSASLLFIPYSKMKEEGYGEYMHLLDE